MFCLALMFTSTLVLSNKNGSSNNNNNNGSNNSSSNNSSTAIRQSLDTKLEPCIARPYLHSTKQRN